MASDKDLRIGIKTEVDPAGITQAKAAIKELGDEAQRTSNIIDATGATPASADQLAAMFQRNSAAAAEFAGRSHLATDATKALEAEVATAEKAANGYAAALNVLGRSLGGIIGRKLTQDVGIEGVGRAIEPILGKQLAGLAGGTGAGEAVAAEGTAAAGAAVGFTSLGVAIAGAVAAGAALAVAGVALTNRLETETQQLIDLGNSWDDYRQRRNKAINDAPTTKDAALEANLASFKKQDELNAKVKQSTTELVATVDDYGNVLAATTLRTKEAVEADKELVQVSNDLAASQAQAARDRDTRPRTDKENADIAKTQQDFNKAAFDALPPLLQQAQAAANLQEYLQKAVGYIGNLKGGVAPTKEQLDEAGKSADGLNKLINQVGDTGAKTMVAGFAAGARSLEDALGKAKDGVDKINKAEADDQAISSKAIDEDKKKLADLVIKQGELAQSKNEGKKVDDGIRTNAEAIAKVTADILAKELEIEASKRRQLDAGKQLKDFQEKQAFDALPQSVKDQAANLDQQIAAGRRVAPEDAAGQEAQAARMRDLLQQRKDVVAQGGSAGTGAGDLDNPFGASAALVAASVDRLQSEAAAQLAQRAAQFVEAIRGMGDDFVNAIRDATAAANSVRDRIKQPGQSDVPSSSLSPDSSATAGVAGTAFDGIFDGGGG